MAEIMNIRQLLQMQLTIPAYQRPYKWTIRNIDELLGDISEAIGEAEKYGTDYKYRIGTIILHDDGSRLNIVDGQQRIISLTLLLLCLDKDYNCSILRSVFKNKITQTNIHANYQYIKEWFFLKTHDRRKYLEAMASTLEVVVITVGDISEAFQLFDSQNTRGKALDPHDLLKAFHLREMRHYPYEMEHAVVKWESKDTNKIRDLFDHYLYPIWNWSRGNKSKSFTANEIDTYKGIEEGSIYTYAKRAGKAMPYFQITEPFIAGNDFFEMVDHYLNLLDDIKKEIIRNDELWKIREICDKTTHSVGFEYAKDLFYCSFLMFYDRFHVFDVMAIKKLFTWALMLRVDMENLGYDSINKYAIGEKNEKYTNFVPVFQKIAMARVHSEVSGIQIRVRRDKDEAATTKWNPLYNDLKELNGY